MAEIAAADALIEEAKIKAEEARKAAEQAKLEELAAKAGRKTTSKPVKRIERVEGQHLTFLVFQGSTFAKEYKGGYIWAPKYTQAGGTCHHWDRLLDVREGDIILHCADGHIEAISVAKGPCFDAESPDELEDVDFNDTSRWPELTQFLATTCVALKAELITACEDELRVVIDGN